MQENAARLARLLSGAAPKAETDVVALNTAALLMTANLAGSLSEGVSMAAKAIGSAAAAKRLKSFIEACNG